MNVTALREVKLLRELRSPYVVRLLEVLPQKKGINLVGGRVGGWAVQGTRQWLLGWASGSADSPGGASLQLPVMPLHSPPPATQTTQPAPKPSSIEPFPPTHPLAHSGDGVL